MLWACIVAKVHPEKLQQLLAYQTMLVREARRCGGTGWQVYDTMLRQQVANNPHADWSKLNSSLYSVTFLAHQNSHGKTCIYCLETDHAGPECVLASNKSYQTFRLSTGDDSRSSEARSERGEHMSRTTTLGMRDAALYPTAGIHMSVLDAKGSIRHPYAPLTHLSRTPSRPGAPRSRMSGMLLYSEWSYRT